MRDLEQEHSNLQNLVKKFVHSSTLNTHFCFKLKKVTNEQLLSAQKFIYSCHVFFCSAAG